MSLVHSPFFFTKNHSLDENAPEASDVNCDTGRKQLGKLLLASLSAVVLSPVSSEA